MTLTVETGSGVQGADSFVTLIEANAYWAANGAPAAWTGLDDAGKESRLRAAARYLGDSQRLPFTGTPLSWDQALAWPRSGATANGAPVPANAVPSVVKVAQCVLAVTGFAAGILGVPSTVPSSAGNVRSKQIGPLAKSFFSPEEMAKGGAAAQVAAPADIVGLLYGLLDVGLLPMPGVVERPVPGPSTGAVLQPSTLLPGSFPDWP